MQIGSSMGHLCSVCIAPSIPHKRRISALKREIIETSRPKCTQNLQGQTLQNNKTLTHSETHTIGRYNKTGESLRLLSSGWRRKIHPTSQRVLINHGLTGSNCLCWIPHLSPSDGALCPTTAQQKKKKKALSIRAWRNRLTPLDL